MYKIHMADLTANLENAGSHRMVLIRLAQLATQVKQVQEMHERSVREMHSKYTEIGTQVRRYKELELKLEEMIEKHNSVVRTFELRMAEMKRVIEDQEIQLMKAADEMRKLTRTRPRDSSL